MSQKATVLKQANEKAKANRLTEEFKDKPAKVFQDSDSSDGEHFGEPKQMVDHDSQSSEGGEFYNKNYRSGSTDSVYEMKKRVEPPLGTQESVYEIKKDEDSDEQIERVGQKDPVNRVNQILQQQNVQQAPQTFLNVQYQQVQAPQESIIEHVKNSIPLAQMGQLVPTQMNSTMNLTPMNDPNKYTGYLQKQQSKFMKLWQTRFFVLSRGNLIYYKTKEDFEKNSSPQGIINFNQIHMTSVFDDDNMTFKLDMKGGNRTFNIKVKDPKSEYSIFFEWKSRITHAIETSQGVKQELSFQEYNNISNIGLNQDSAKDYHKFWRFCRITEQDFLQNAEMCDVVLFNIKSKIRNKTGKHKISEVFPLLRLQDPGQEPDLYVMRYTEAQGLVVEKWAIFKEFIKISKANLLFRHLQCQRDQSFYLNLQSVLETIKAYPKPEPNAKVKFQMGPIIFAIYKKLGIILNEEGSNAANSIYSQNDKSLKFIENVSLGDEQSIMIDGKDRTHLDQTMLTTQVQGKETLSAAEIQAFTQQAAQIQAKAHPTVQPTAQSTVQPATQYNKKLKSIMGAGANAINKNPMKGINLKNMDAISAAAMAQKMAAETGNENLVKGANMGNVLAQNATVLKNPKKMSLSQGMGLASGLAEQSGNKNLLAGANMASAMAKDPMSMIAEQTGNKNLLAGANMASAMAKDPKSMNANKIAGLGGALAAASGNSKALDYASKAQGLADKTQGLDLNAAESFLNNAKTMDPNQAAEMAQKMAGASGNANASKMANISKGVDFNAAKGMAAIMNPQKAAMMAQQSSQPAQQTAAQNPADQDFFSEGNAELPPIKSSLMMMETATPPPTNGEPAHMQMINQIQEQKAFKITLTDDQMESMMQKMADGEQDDMMETVTADPELMAQFMAFMTKRSESEIE